MGLSKLYLTFILCCIVRTIMADPSDLDTMLTRFPRAAQAAANTEAFWVEKCKTVADAFPPEQLFIRAYKEEKKLEIWGGNPAGFVLLKTYDICTVPGVPGPKIRQGDKQVPEGFYMIDSINPDSEFHLSLRINYPNAADTVRSREEKDPGGDIFIHGDCYSVGCLPMEDAPMEEIFWIVVRFLNRYADKKVRVLVLPFDLQDAQKYAWYTVKYPQWTSFWDSLKNIDFYFSEMAELPDVFVNEEGQYQIRY